MFFFFFYLFVNSSLNISHLIPLKIPCSRRSDRGDRTKRPLYFFLALLLSAAFLYPNVCNRPPLKRSSHGFAFPHDFPSNFLAVVYFVANSHWGGPSLTLGSSLSELCNIPGDVTIVLDWIARLP